MGYWKGNIFDSKPDDPTWGDAPADIMAEAVEQIIFKFEEDLHRKPTKRELREGLEFHIRILDELAD
jgi:hypothetical protein